MEIAPVEHGLRVTAFNGMPFRILCWSNSATAQSAHEW